MKGREYNDVKLHVKVRGESDISFWALSVTYLPTCPARFSAWNVISEGFKKL